LIQGGKKITALEKTGFRDSKNPWDVNKEAMKKISDPKITGF